MVKVSKDKIAEVGLLLIDEPKTPARMEIDKAAVEELAKSISEIGLLQPIVLRGDGERYEIIAGHRRFLAHRKLELPAIKAIVKTMTDQEAIIARATENLSRVDLTPVEEAAIYADLVDGHGMSFEQVGQKMGKTPGTIKRRMDILKMPPQLQQAVHKGQVSMSAAEELWSISNEVDLEYYLLFAIENGCTKEVARSWARDWRDSQRRAQDPSVEGGHSDSPAAPRPVYLPCDLCSGPTNLEDAHRMLICSECFATIKANM